MEANTLTLVLVGAIIAAMVVLILIRNNRDKDDFYKSLNASEDQAAQLDRAITEEE